MNLGVRGKGRAGRGGLIDGGSKGERVLERDCRENGWMVVCYLVLRVGCYYAMKCNAALQFNM